MRMFGKDTYSVGRGFTLCDGNDERKFRTLDAAVNFLAVVCGMEYDEAYSYCTRLVKRAEQLVTGCLSAGR